MISTASFLQAMIPLYFIIIAGFLSRKYNIFPAHSIEVMTQMLLYVTLPALILYSLNTTITSAIIREFIWLVTMSIFILTVAAVVAAFLRKIAALPKTQKSAYESLIIFGNQGFIGFAVIFILMEEQGIMYLTFFNIVYFIFIWSYGIYIFTKSSTNINWRPLFLNPGILASAIGILMLCLPYEWPKPIFATLEMVGKMTVPLSMLLIGSLLANMNRAELQSFSKNKYIWIAALYKLIFIPLFLLIFLLFSVPFPLLIVAILTTATPTASTVSIYAQKYGGDAAFASFGVVVTTVLCMVTLPFLYYVLLKIEFWFL